MSLPLDAHHQGPLGQAEILGPQVVTSGDLLLHPRRTRKSQRPGGAARGQLIGEPHSVARYISDISTLVQPDRPDDGVDARCDGN